MVENGTDIRTGEGEGEAADATMALQAEVAALKEQVLRYAAEADNTKRWPRRRPTTRAPSPSSASPATCWTPPTAWPALWRTRRRLGRRRCVNNFVMGVEMTEKALQTAFERNGLKMVNPAKGEKFDLNLHQAVMEQPAEGVLPGLGLAGDADGLPTVRPHRPPGDGGGDAQGPRPRPALCRPAAAERDGGAQAIRAPAMQQFRARRPVGPASAP